MPRTEYQPPPATQISGADTEAQLLAEARDRDLADYDLRQASLQTFRKRWEMGEARLFRIMQAAPVLVIAALIWHKQLNRANIPDATMSILIFMSPILTSFLLWALMQLSRRVREVSQRRLAYRLGLDSD